MAAKTALEAVCRGAHTLLKSDASLRNTLLAVASSVDKLSEVQQDRLQPLFNGLDSKAVVAVLAGFGITEYDRSIKHLATRDESGYRHFTARRAAFVICQHWNSFAPGPLSTEQVTAMQLSVGQRSKKATAAPAKTAPTAAAAASAAVAVAAALTAAPLSAAAKGKLPKQSLLPPPPVLSADDEDDDQFADEDNEDQFADEDNRVLLSDAVTQAYVSTAKINHAQEELQQLLAVLVDGSKKTRPSQVAEALKRISAHLVTAHAACDQIIGLVEDEE